MGSSASFSGWRRTRPSSLKRRLSVASCGGLVVTGERDDDVAVLGVLRPLDDDDVAVEDSRVDHRVALDAKQELLPAARERLRHGEVALDVVLGEQRPTCGDLADERELVDVRWRRPSARGAARARAASSDRA